LFQEVKKAVQQGLFKTGEFEPDFSKMQDRKNDNVDKNSKGVDFLMRKNKVTVIRGYGTIMNPTKIAVKGAGDAALIEIDTKNIIIATGSEAKSLPGYS